MINNTEAEALHAFLTEGGPVSRGDLPSNLPDQFSTERTEHLNCPVTGCLDDVEVLEETDETYLIRCHSYHNSEVPKGDILCDPHFEAVLTEVARSVDLSPKHFTGDRLPQQAKLRTQEGVNIYLVYAPRDDLRVVKRVYEDAIETQSPSLLLLPRNEIMSAVEIQYLFSTRHLVQVVPVKRLSESSLLEETIRTIRAFEDFHQDILTKRFGDDVDKVREQAVRNPSYILSLLSNLRMLRKNKEIKKGDGSLLENVSEATFMHLFPTLPGRGGEDDTSKSLPDNLFYIWEEGSYESVDYEPILGIVDTKSGATANFGSEKVKGKQQDYVEAAKKYSFKNGSVAHIFLVLDFDGQQELNYYDRMKQEYEENMYMLVLTVDAFLTLFAAYLSAVFSNELRLTSGDFTRAVYPLFHQETLFKDDYENIRWTYREVGQLEEKYQRKYNERPDLLVITREAVLKHFRNLTSSDSEIEEILERYFL